mgnify:CR=1 FL=1
MLVFYVWLINWEGKGRQGKINQVKIAFGGRISGLNSSPAALPGGQDFQQANLAALIDPVRNLARSKIRYYS